MDLATRFVLLLIFFGFCALVYIVGGIIDALTTYIKHTKKRRAREHRHNSPLANNRKGGQYGRAHN